MNPKDMRSRWLAGVLLAGALGLGFAIYLGTSRTVDAPGPIGQELQDNPANRLDPLPNAAANPSAPLNPAAFLLGHRRQHGSAEQGNPNAAIDFNEPARTAAETPTDTAAPGSSSEIGQSPAHSLTPDMGPPGVPIDAKNLGRTSEALRNKEPPSASTSQH